MLKIWSIYKIQLEVFAVQSPENAQATESMVQLKSLDTLRTLQLLGFNYKKALENL